MKMRHVFLASAFCASVAALAAPSSAATVYVGSWTVSEGPHWSTVPTAYTGQEAAALLFGGSANDYVISTISNVVAQIDHLAWVSTWGGACGGAQPCGTKVAEDFEISTGGLYATPGDTSAYVDDWAYGSAFRNYAFRVDSAVPEPASWAMMIGGLALVGASLRRRSVAVSFA
jgi:hypothetical protein